MFRKSRFGLSNKGRVVYLGRPSFKYFLREHAYHLSALFIILALVGYGVYVKADVYEYYPSSCLGNWVGVDNVLGGPELDLGSSIQDFNLENSAQFPGGDAQIYCGNFSGGGGTEKTFQSAELNLVWAFVPSPEIIPVLPEIPGLNTSTSTEENQTPTSTVSRLRLFNIALAAEEEVPSPSSESESTVTPPSEAVSEAPLENDPPPQDAVLESNSDTPSESPAVSGDANSNASTTETSPPSSTLKIPFDVSEPPAYQNNNPSADDLLSVSVSLDGKEWITLGTVNENNWQGNSVFNLSMLKNWDQLNSLQVSIRGLGRPGAMPNIYLEGMTVEVHTDSDFMENFIVQRPPQPDGPMEIFDNSAPHHCSIKPFEINLRPNQSGDLEVTLYPSSTEDYYSTALGDLPSGVQGSLKPNGTSTDSMIIKILPDQSAISGSYSLGVQYKAHEPDGRTIINICQYNLVIN